MSYILDALRKSEHERQVIAGQNAGMLYPLEIKRNHNAWLFPALLVGAVLVVLALIWRMWTQPIVTGTTNMPEVPVTFQPQTISQERIPEPVSQHEEHAPVYAQKKVHSPVRLDTSQQQPANLETKPSTTQSPGTVDNKPVSVDPLIGLPPLSISGYVHNEQSGSLAMINNRLVHEGDEISPGLRLIKILDGSAIFSYKGYVFTR